MRKIKFRIWNKYHKRMYSVNSINFETGIVECSDIETGTRHSFCFIDFILMQHVGIKDKNGVEIYEGDIIKDGRNNVGTVVFDTDNVGSCGCCFSEFHGSGFIAVVKDDNYALMSPEAIVIGNIYQNQELFGVTNDKN